MQTHYPFFFTCKRFLYCGQTFTRSYSINIYLRVQAWPQGTKSELSGLFPILRQVQLFFTRNTKESANFIKYVHPPSERCAGKHSFILRCSLTVENCYSVCNILQQNQAKIANIPHYFPDFSLGSTIDFVLFEIVRNCTVDRTQTARQTALFEMGIYD